MRISSFTLAALVLAAGSEASPFPNFWKRHFQYKRDCVKRQDNSTATTTTEADAVNAQTPNIQASTIQTGNNQTANTRPSNTTAGTGAATAGSGGFCNTVFNTDVGGNPGFPSTTWQSLTSNGVDDWIGFSVTTLDQTASYNGAKTNAALNGAQIPIVMDPTQVQAGLDRLKSNPPPYLELFNEPDYSWENVTPLTDPVAAASALAPFFTTPHAQTTYISPALAQANSDWLATFRDNCNNCFDQIPIISQHIYSPSTDYVMGEIQQLHGTWPDKKIWITELSPASGDCTLDGPGVINWMNTLLPQIQALGYVEKVFWNCGENSPGLPGNVCNPSLTNADGSANALLQAYGKLCGGGGGPSAAS